MIVAIPDALATRQAVAYARARNPRVEIVARAHSEAEEAELRRLGVSRVVVAEREVGNELVRHALRRFGVSDREAAAIIESRRARLRRRSPRATNDFGDPPGGVVERVHHSNAWSGRTPPAAV